MSEHTAPTRQVGLSGYAAGCRCDGCSDARRKWSKGYEKRLYLSGRKKLTVNAARVRRHLRWLQDNGVGYERIAELAGLTAPHVSRIANGRTKRVAPKTAGAILAIGRDSVADTAVVDSTLTWKRIHGLLALGWSSVFINEQLGYTPRNTVPISRYATTVKNARAVAELCRTFGSTPGPSEGSRRVARRYGWAPYGEWDDDLDELTDFTTVICGHCNKSFQPSKFGRRPTYCSDICRHAAGNAREKEAKSA